MENALSDWNGKLAEIWTLLTKSPQEFKGGEIWNVISGIHTALVGVGYGLLVLFFAIGIFQSTVSFRDFQRPEFALRHFIRFIMAKLAVGSCMEIMTAIFSLCGGIVNTVMGGMGGSISMAATLPDVLVNAIESLGLLASIPLWLVSLLGSLFMTVMSFILLLTVYGRFFRLYMYTALAPLPLASFAAEGTSASGKAFLKSYIAVCMEGLPDLFGLPVQQHAHAGSSPTRRHDGVAVHRPAYIQHAHFDRPCKRRRPYCQRDVRVIKPCQFFARMR